MSERGAAMESSGTHVACITAMPPEERDLWHRWFNGDDEIV